MTSIYRKTVRGIVSVPAHLAFHWTKRNPTAVENERRHPESLRNTLVMNSPSPQEAAVIAGLEQHGVFKTSLADLSMDDHGASTEDGEFMVQARQLGALLAVRATAFGDTLPDTVASDASDLTRHPAVYRWGLNAVMLRIAEVYLRRPVAYDGAQVQHNPPDDREVGSRLWHMDREDHRVIKVGLYLNDVDEDGGPLQLHKQEVDHDDPAFSYRRLTTAGLRKLYDTTVNPDDIITCAGNTSTLVFTDTARFFHRSKPASGVARSAVFFTYFARPPQHPFYSGSAGLSRRDTAKLTEGMHPTQLASAFWRDELSWPARLIPFSPG